MDFEEVKKVINKKREEDCFGCTIAELREANKILFKGPEALMLLSASIQSDCQEVMAMYNEFDDVDPKDMIEQVRQYLNRSKYCLSEATRLLRAERDPGK